MAIISVAAICNEALGHIGVKEQIADIGDPSSVAAACALSYPRVLGEMLERHRWAFAEKRATLSVIDDDELISGWIYMYALPSDLIAPRLLWSGQLQAAISDRKNYKEHYDSTGTVLLSNLADAELEYTALVEQQVRFGQQFVQALTLHLASRLARRLAEDPDSTSLKLLREAELAESRAAAVNLNNQRVEGFDYRSLNPYILKR